MEGGARRGRPGYDQQTVLRRAVEVFNRQGYDGTSMGDLARELGVGKSALYHHVPGKEALLSQALDEALDGLTAVLDRPAGTTAYDRLAALVSAAAAEGSLRSDLPPDLVSRLLFGMVNSLVEWYRPGGAVDAEQLADALATLAFEGLNT